MTIKGVDIISRQPHMNYNVDICCKDLMKQLVDRSQIVKRASNAVIYHFILCYHQEWRKFVNLQSIVQVLERIAVVLMKALVISS